MSLDGFGLVVEPEFVEELESIVELVVPDVEPLGLDVTPLVVAPVEPVVSVDPEVEPLEGVVVSVEPVEPDVVPEVAPLVVLSDVVPVVPGVEFAVLPAVPVLPLSIGVVPVDGLPVLPLEDVPVP